MFRTMLIATLLAGCGMLAAQSIPVPNATPLAYMPEVTGNVRTIVEYNDVIYIGGEFTHVGGYPRANLAAINATTGQLLPWTPNPDGFVQVMKAYAGRLYVGGGFTMIGGEAVRSLCSFDTAAHTLTNWRPALALPATVQNLFFDDDVHCMQIVGSRLYVGGGFLLVNGTPRGGLCCFDLFNLGSNDGLTPWDPNLRGPINTSSPIFLVMGAQSIYIDPVSDLCFVTGGILEYGGDHQADGSPSGHMLLTNYAALVSASGTGAPVDAQIWNPTFEPTPGGWLVVNTCFGIGSTVYISGLIGGIRTTGGGTAFRDHAAAMDMTGNTNTSNVVTAFNPMPNERIFAWATDPSQSVLFAGGHFTALHVDTRQHLAMLDPATGATATAWAPEPDSSVLALLVTGSRVYVGGNFANISGGPRAGFAVYEWAAPAAASSAPYLAVSTHTGSVSDGDVIHVSHNTALSALGIQINVSDADGGDISLGASLPNGHLAQLQTAEWTSAAQPGPYSVTPSSGQFLLPGALVEITLQAMDAQSHSTQLRFFIQVSASTPPGDDSAPENGDGGGPAGTGGCASGGATAIWALFALPLRALRRRRR